MQETCINLFGKVTFMVLRKERLLNRGGKEGLSKAVSRCATELYVT